MDNKIVEFSKKLPTIIKLVERELYKSVVFENGNL